MYPTGEHSLSTPQGPAIDERSILSQSVNSQGTWVVVLVSLLWQVWEYDLTGGYKGMTCDESILWYPFYMELYSEHV